jgi:predicted patatin/cPLA2 family phospholipase
MWPRNVLMCGMLATLAGCVGARNYPPPDVPAHVRLIPVEATAHLAAVRTALVLSGGGARGAFAAGVLRGWSEAHTRPEFDVVTGVSTGALIAPFAFLGPAYDDRLEAIYTNTDEHDVFRRRFLAGLLWADSLADPTPLRTKISAEVTPDLLDRIAAEHRKGRRLYVATTDLDTKQQVVWDLGAIAAGGTAGRRTLFCNVIMASCSFPAVFPPVQIDVEIDGRRRTELHVDGVVSASAFLPRAVLGVGPLGIADPGRGRAEVYVILSGRLSPARKAVERRLTPISEEALTGVLAGRQSDDVLKLYLLCRYVGAGYHMAAVPEDLLTDENALTFDTAKMRLLHARGQDVGRNGRWTETPPWASSDEQSIPRGGLRLKAVARVPDGGPEATEATTDQSVLAEIPLPSSPNSPIWSPN